MFFFNIFPARSLGCSTIKMSWVPPGCICRPISTKNHYETLKLSKNCSSGEIRDAFITLSKKYHPDRNTSNPKAKELFVEINEAYNVLIKPETRREYDFSMQHFNQPSRVYRSKDPTDYYEIHRYDPHFRDPWKDPSFASNRRFRKDWGENYYYGFKNIGKIPNTKIVYGVGIFVAFGLLLQLYIVFTYNTIQRLSAEKNTEENRQHLIFVRTRADNFETREKQVEELKKRLNTASSD